MMHQLSVYNQKSAKKIQYKYWLLPFRTIISQNLTEHMYTDINSNATAKTSHCNSQYNDNT